MQFLLVLVLAVARYSSSGQSFQGVSVLDPVHVVIPLPQDDTSDFGRNPFQLSIPKVRPVVDLALEQAYKMSYVPRNSIAVTYRDSKLSDAHGPNVAVEQYVKKQIDCIIGYAFVYALAPVARMTPFWGNGIPVITPIGLTMNLDDKTEYQLMTRISSPYKLAANAVKELFVQMTWKRHVFMFHHAKTTPSVPVGECFMLMASIQTMLRDVLEMQHNFYMFNEESSQARADKRAEYKEILTQSSFVANAPMTSTFFLVSGLLHHRRRSLQMALRRRTRVLSVSPAGSDKLLNLFKNIQIGLRNATREILMECMRPMRNGDVDNIAAAALT